MANVLWRGVGFYCPGDISARLPEEVDPRISPYLNGESDISFQIFIPYIHHWNKII